MPEAGDGDVLVRNVFMSVDPYMRGRMNDAKSYAPPFQIGQPLDGRAVGRVVESRHAELQVGDYVSSGLGWREYFVSDGSAERGALDKLDPGVDPLSLYLGVLGMPGMTAWLGMSEIGKPQRGETVFVSGAAGAVGSVAGQLASLEGCRVVGSAGSDAKVAFVTDELGFDAAFNYKSVDFGRGNRGGLPQRGRRVLRQRGWGAFAGRARADERLWTTRRVRHDLAVQRGVAHAGTKQSCAYCAEAAACPRVHCVRQRGPRGRVSLGDDTARRGGRDSLSGKRSWRDWRMRRRRSWACSTATISARWSCKLGPVD